jgi:hypothetical protein
MAGVRRGQSVKVDYRWMERIEEKFGQTVSKYGGVPFFGVMEMSLHFGGELEQKVRVSNDATNGTDLIYPANLRHRPIINLGIDGKEGRECNVSASRCCHRCIRNDCVRGLTPSGVTVCVELELKMNTEGG